MKKILDLTNGLGIPEDFVIPYGHDKAKIDLAYKNEIEDRPTGKLVLVTAITPTKAGEGKTTTAVGIGDALKKLNKKKSATPPSGSFLKQI